MLDWRPSARATARPIAMTERRMMERLGAQRLTLPTFMSIGAPQSGTTWLYRNLLLHPDVGIPIKEVRFFDSLLHRPLWWYSRLYRAKPRPSRGDMSTSYMRLNTRQVSFVHRLMPNLRIILIVRNPVERAWSGYRRRARHDERPSWKDMEQYLKWTVHITNRRTQYSIEYSYYSLALETWLSYFPVERIHVASFDDIQRRPMAFIQRILQHIDVDPDKFPWSHMERNRINPNAELAIPQHIKRGLEARYAGEHARLAEALGAKDAIFWEV